MFFFSTVISYICPGIIFPVQEHKPRSADVKKIAGEHINVCVSLFGISIITLVYMVFVFEVRSVSP